MNNAKRKRRATLKEVVAYGFLFWSALPACILALLATGGVLLHWNIFAYIIMGIMGLLLLVDLPILVYILFLNPRLEIPIQREAMLYLKREVEKDLKK